MTQTTKSQKERAKQCRYKNMAMKVQGNISMIYSPDYNGDIGTEFGTDTVPKQLLECITGA